VSAPTGRRVGAARDAAALFLRGLAMGAADIIPGVSGGTVALVTGIYERLIGALGSLSPAFLAPLARGRVREAARAFGAMDWGVLVPVFGGVGASAVVMSRIVPGLMEEAPGPTYAFFFGLILAAVWAPFARLRRRDWTRWVTAGAVAALAWLFVGMQPQSAAYEVIHADAGAETAILPERVRDPAQIDAAARAARAVMGDGLRRLVVYPRLGESAPPAPAGVELVQVASRAEALRLAGDGPVVTLGAARSPLPVVFVFGVVAISAMILPGLSGAFLMLFFGQYHALLSAIHGVTAPIVAWAGLGEPAAASRSWLDDAVFLGVFNVGVLIGLVLFSRAVRWLLTHAHDITMAALIGLMLGGLRQPAHEVQGALAGGGPSWWGVGLAALAGAAVVTALNRFDARARRASASAAGSDPAG